MTADSGAASATASRPTRPPRPARSSSTPTARRNGISTRACGPPPTSPTTGRSSACAPRTSPSRPPWSSEKGRRFYVYNVRAELDAPGEVYWDRKTGVVDFIPPKDGVTEFRAAVTEGPIVSATGASGIEFDGITFEYAAGDGLLLENCTNCGIFGCQVRNVGANGVTIRGGRSCRVRGSFIEGCGLGGADVSGGDRRSLTPCDHEIAGCTISRFGVLQRTYAPGVRVGGVGVHLAHNVFHDAPHSAVIYAGNDHLFEHNEVYGIMQETGDAGAFYSGRDPLSRGNVLRFNYVHDLGRPNDTAANTMAF